MTCRLTPRLPGAEAPRYDEAWRAFYRMKLSPAQKQTRALVQAAAAVCEDKKGQHTCILELDPADSGLSDFFLITSATNQRQAVTIADEIELRLKREFGVYPQSVEGRRNGEWILLDYVDFVVHVFLTERRTFYDIERLRKSAHLLTPAEFDAQLKTELAKKMRVVRTKSTVKKRRASAKPPTEAKKPLTRAERAKKTARSGRSPTSASRSHKRRD